MACVSLYSLDFCHLATRPRRASRWNWRAFAGKTREPTFVRQIMGSDRRPAQKSKWKSSVSARNFLLLPISLAMEGCQTAKLLKGFKDTEVNVRLDGFAQFLVLFSDRYTRPHPIWCEMIFPDYYFIALLSSYTYLHS